MGKRESFDAVSTADTLVQVQEHGTTGVALKQINSIPARMDPKKDAGPVATQVLAVFASMFQLFGIILTTFHFFKFFFFK